MRDAAGSTSMVSRHPRDGWRDRRPSLAVPQHGSEAAVWRIFAFNGELLAIITGVVVAVLVTSEFRIEPLGYVIVFAVATLYWKFGRRHLNTGRWNPRVSFCLMSLAQLAFAISMLTTLTYLAMAIRLPLQDELLLAWDRALGLDFRKFLDVVNQYPELVWLLTRSYSSITWQLLLVAIVLPLLGCYRRVGEAVCAFILSLLATTCISALVPAIGVYDLLELTPADHPHFQPQGYYDTARDAPLLRSGDLRLLDLPRLVGILTFPSFHAVAAILYIWAFWPVAWLRPVAVPWNVAMIAATPLGGGHYFVDIIAGIVVALAAILAARRIGEFVAPAATQAGSLAADAVEPPDDARPVADITPTSAGAVRRRPWRSASIPWRRSAR